MWIKLLNNTLVNLNEVAFMCKENANQPPNGVVYMINFEFSYWQHPWSVVYDTELERNNEYDRIWDILNGRR